MATHTAMRIASTAPGSPDPAPGDAQASATGGFPAALTAARAEKSATAAADRDARAAPSDPALAAALAAMLSTTQMPGPQGTMPDDAAFEGTEALSGETAATLTSDELLLASLQDEAGDGFDAQLAAMNERGGALEGDADNLLRLMSREMALSRDQGAALRATTTEPRTGALEMPAGSAGTHAATQLAGVTAPAPAVAATANAQVLHAPVGTPRWADELGSRLVMMSTRGQNEGSLTLSPEHLGPLEVRISMNQNTANVWFGAQHADTRAALSEAMPRLREMLAQSGLSLGHAGVSQETPREQAGRAQALESGAGADGFTNPVEGEVQTVRRAVRGLIDLYA